MPYDPRPVSQGGNRGIDEQFSRKAPSGMTMPGFEQHPMTANMARKVERLL